MAKAKLPLRIYLAEPFDDNGVEEAWALTDPTGDVFDVRTASGTVWHVRHCYREGYNWFRTKDAALAAAAKFRQERIAKAASEIAKLSALPPLVAAP